MAILVHKSRPIAALLLSNRTLGLFPDDADDGLDLPSLTLFALEPFLASFCRV